LPSVQKLYQDLRGKGLEVLLIDIREDAEQVRRTVKERGYVTPVLLDQSGDVAGPGYRVWGPPTGLHRRPPGPAGRPGRRRPGVG
jgi:hypothetical protein